MNENNNYSSFISFENNEDEALKEFKVACSFLNDIKSFLKFLFDQMFEFIRKLVDLVVPRKSKKK